MVIVIISLVLGAALILFLATYFQFSTDVKSKSVTLANKNCDQLDPGSKLDCFLKFSVTQQDMLVCERLGEVFLTECSKSKDSIFEGINCNKYQDTIVPNCIARIGIENNNYDICKEANTKNLQDRCFKEISIQEEEDLCNLITNNKIRDECYLDLSQLVQDLYICDKIGNSVLAKICLGEKEKTDVTSDISLFIMSPPLVAGEFSINSIDNSISFEITQGESDDIYLISSEDAEQDAIRLKIIGDQEGTCKVTVASEFPDVITDLSDPENNNQYDKKAENPWLIGDRITFQAFCYNEEGDGLTWEKGNLIRAEIDVKYSIGNGVIELDKAGQLLGNSV